MDTLPKEIFISIISLLTQQDKFNCIQVCHDWHRIISSSSLYHHLEFKSTEQLKCAMPWFEANDCFLGRHVQQLNLLQCDPDLSLLESLPTMFPNTKELKWLENEDMSESNNTVLEQRPVTEYHHLQNFEKWNRLERIVDMPRLLPFSTLLLETGPLLQLKQLEVSFHYTLSSTDKTNLLKSLIQKLQNAPTLENLLLGKVQISLKDMEDLHRNTPRLRDLQLCDANLTIEDIALEDVSPLRGFESFQFMPRNAAHLRDEKNVSAIIKWFEYMGKKYTDLCHLKILANNKKLPQQDSQGLEDSIINALLHMPHLQTYIMELYPMTDRILSAFNENHVHLKKMNLCIENESKLQDDCSLVQFAKSTQHIEALTIAGTSQCDIYDDYMLSYSIIRMTSSLAHLVDLRVSNIPEGGFQLLINILQNLSGLQTLCFDGLEFEEEDYELQHMPINKCSIKKLDISVYPNSEYQLESLNHNFEFILKSCPLLEEFELSGGFYVYPCEDTFNLNFAKHKKLKSIAIDRSGADYNYVFDHIPVNMGKCWNDYNSLSAEDDELFQCKLIWEGNVDIYLY